MKILFIVPYPIQAASTRYRVEQYLPFLRAHGIEPTVSRFIHSSDFFARLYEPGRVAYKGVYIAARTLRRLLDLGRVGRYDVVMIQREALPIGPPLFEKLAAVFNAPIVFDFDDAIYLHHASEANRWISWLKQPKKTAEIIRISQHVIVGNQELAQYARKYNRRVSIIPSSIDMQRYVPKPNVPPDHAEHVVIGWVGSNSTAQYLEPLASVFQDLAKSHHVRFHIVGGRPTLPNVGAMFAPWILENEIKDLHGFDIGIMPLPDTPWTRGKGGFKAIQYMGVGIPAVASPVGINREFICDGVNGFLPDTLDEWYRVLAMLVEDGDLRRRIGRAGRETVATAYSLQANAPKLLDILLSCAKP